MVVLDRRFSAALDEEPSWQSETAPARAHRQARLARLDGLLGRIEDFNASCGVAVLPDPDLLHAYVGVGGFLPGPLALTGGELLDAVLELQLGLMRRRAG